MMKTKICLLLAAIIKENTRRSTMHQGFIPVLSFKDAVADALKMKEALEWLSSNSEFTIEKPNGRRSTNAFLAD